MSENIRNREGALVEEALDAIDEAAQEKPDIICLPEDYDLLARPPEKEKEYKGEDIPGGPITTRMQEKAAKYDCYIVSTLLEATASGRPYNTATLIGRDGSIIGKYRKIHLAPDESAHIQPGSEPLVLECDFGRVAMMICMDLHYPELARIYALQGADIVFWPTMAGDWLPFVYQQTLRVRAIDNRCYCVCSDYCYITAACGIQTGEACIVDPLGSVRASTGRRPGVATAVVDLDEVGDQYSECQSPSLREQHLGSRRPDIYGAICYKDEKRLWELKNPRLVGGP
jgi:predicted amidohydrolase